MVTVHAKSMVFSLHHQGRIIATGSIQVTRGIPDFIGDEEVAYLEEFRIDEVFIDEGHETYEKIKPYLNGIIRIPKTKYSPGMDLLELFKN